MFPIHVSPLPLDQSIAASVAHRTNPASEELASFLTWGADEHLLIAGAAAFWFLSRSGSQRDRTAGTHLLTLAFVSGVAPHLTKRLFNQRRPDRLTAIGHVRGVPISGRANDAFPSGHAVHMGALASAACEFPPKAKNVAWTAAVGLSLTRIAILAHWTSDVMIGFVSGFMLDRLLRRLTGYPGGREGG
jgi:membrane-associated phospholipid phosphatase